MNSFVHFMLSLMIMLIRMMETSELLIIILIIIVIMIFIADILTFFIECFVHNLEDLLMIV